MWQWDEISLIDKIINIAAKYVSLLTLKTL